MSSHMANIFLGQRDGERQRARATHREVFQNPVGIACEVAMVRTTIARPILHIIIPKLSEHKRRSPPYTCGTCSICVVLREDSLRSTSG
eukprot:5904111-Amphidinium_carterae.1